MPYVVYLSVNDRISVPLPSDVSVKTLQMSFAFAANTTRMPIPVPGFSLAGSNPDVLGGVCRLPVAEVELDRDVRRLLVDPAAVRAR